MTNEQLIVLLEDYRHDMAGILNMLNDTRGEAAAGERLTYVEGEIEHWEKRLRRAVSILRGE